MASGWGGCLATDPCSWKAASTDGQMDLNEGDVQLNYYFLILVLPGRGVDRQNQCTEILYPLGLPSQFVL